MSSFNSTHTSYGSYFNEDIYIDSSKNCTKADLYSKLGKINVKGSAGEKLIFDNATARHDIRVDNVVIKGKVFSEFGNVFATRSNLGDVVARHDIDLINSSARHIQSKFGNVKVKQTTGIPSQISSILARQKVKVDQVSVNGKIESEFGDVVANQSSLGDVAARHDIDLINSSARHIQSRFGDVKVKQTTDIPSQISSILARQKVKVDQVSVNGKIESEFGDVVANQSTLGNVTTRHDIDLTNSSATSLLSHFGYVTVRQTDGIQRSISHITARNRITAENSVIENVILYINPDQKAVLDLTNTQVSEKIVIKVNDSFTKIIRIVFNLFSWPFFRHEESSVNGSKHFSLLVKGDVMPKNIFFDGFEEDEINFQTVDNGILVTGEKK